MNRKTLLLVMSVILLSIYTMLTDPYTSNTLLDNVPYGIELLFLVKVFILSITLITMMNYLVDVIVDRAYGVDEKDLVKQAMNTPEGAGHILISRAIIFLSGGVIILGVLIYFGM